MNGSDRLAEYMRKELKILARLAAPAILTQLGTMLMGVVDTLMVARVGTEALGAAAIANVWVSLILWGSMGLIFGMDPIVSQAHGAGDGRRAALALQRGVVLAVLISIPIGLLFCVWGALLKVAGQEPELAELAHEYLIVQIPSIGPVLVYIALRQYLQGRTLVWPAMWAMLAANGFNVVANWALIFGHLGAPPLGLLGAGIATSVVRVFTLLSLVAVVWWRKLHRDAWVPWSWQALDPRGLREILRFGIPVWVHLLLETAAFVASSLLAGYLGVSSLAANTVALNLASLAFMVPLGVSIAASTRVGNLVGARDVLGVHRATRTSLILGAAAMSVSAALFLGAPLWLARLYTHDPVVVTLCGVLLPIAGAFQLFDGVQVVAAGVLRGLGHTRPSAVAQFLGHWVLALPLGAWLTFSAGWGIAGLWWGFVAGLGAVAFGLVLWIKRVLAAGAFSAR